MLARRSLPGFRSSHPPIGAGDAHCLLAFPTQAKFGGGEQAIDDVVVLADAVIDELAVAFRSDHEERRRIALGETARHFDIDLGTVIERREWPPRRIVAGDLIAKAKFRDVDASVDRRRRGGRDVLTAKRDKLVLRVLPGHGRHVGRARRAQFEKIGPPIGIDDEVGQKVRPRRLHQDVDTFGGTRAAFGVADDDAAHGISGRNGAGTDEFLTLLEGDTGDLTRRRVDLVEGASGEGIDLHGVDEAFAHRLRFQILEGRRTFQDLIFDLSVSYRHWRL